MLQWFLEASCFPILLPSKFGAFSVEKIVKEIDGLLLQGGSDVCPESYGEEALQPEWSGDRYRDLYEIELIQECIAKNKPILGICRGHQILNVALGGSLYQDIQTQCKGALIHRNWEIYDSLEHEIHFTRGSILTKIFPGYTGGKIISIHHQAIKVPAASLSVDALSTEDGIIEAVHYKTERQQEANSSFALGLQWHPEFQTHYRTHLLSRNSLLEYYIKQVELRR
ncbi:MAG: gamma-glutamyl-gamma-aminobutyrate hydrolase family protein [Leptospiraceae bacterium]|nr:gamma-glutamyl-gamma-aminobutyrate hydrolase family protein [Leptospiraceae bacterium]